jgi:hypothetical protein
MYKTGFSCKPISKPHHHDPSAHVFRRMINCGEEQKLSTPPGPAQQPLGSALQAIPSRQKAQKQVPDSTTWPRMNYWRISDLIIRILQIASAKIIGATKESNYWLAPYCS